MIAEQVERIPCRGCEPLGEDSMAVRTGDAEVGEGGFRSQLWACERYGHTFPVEERLMWAPQPDTEEQALDNRLRARRERYERAHPAGEGAPAAPELSVEERLALLEAERNAEPKTPLDAEAPKEGARLWPCKVCGAPFASSQRLAAHSRSHKRR